MQTFQGVQAVCFPFAGGNEFSYDQMTTFKSFDLKTASLPGRGSRVGEKLQKSIKGLLNDFWKCPNFDPNQPYFLYGHSMGSLLAYEVALECKRREIRSPLLLLVSGRQAPNFGDKRNLPRHLMTKESFWEELKGYGGIPKALFNEPELLDYFEPIIRADFEAVYHYRQSDDLKLDIPVIATAGDQENISHNELNSWSEVTTGEFTSIRFSGNHFFIFDHATRLKMLVEASIVSSFKMTVDNQFM